MSAVAIAGCALVALGGVAALVPGWAVRAVDLQLAGCAALAAAAVAVLAGGPPLGVPFHDALAPALGLDRLSALFLALLAAVAVPALLLARDALRDDGVPGRPLAGVTAVFLLALVAVLGARDVVTFLAGWEAMTLAPAVAILVARRDRLARHAVFVYVAVNHLGGIGVWVALLALAHAGALGGAAPSGGLQAVVAVAALVGFGTKAGLIPLHAWLPRAHPIAPAHISALMSAAMVNVALYGLIRVLFAWDAPAPLWVGAVLLALGALSALGGVLYALVQRELKRLLAFSTIENVGIAALGLGAAVMLAAGGARTWSAFAFAAALLQLINHALAKALLFLGAGAFSRAAGALELNSLGGLLRRMPWSGWTFLLGCAAIAGVPPLGGFAAEWLTLQSLLHLAYQPAPGVALAGALATAGLGAAAALAVLCFATVIGLVLLGASRGERAAAAVEQPRSTRLALVLLAGLCLMTAPTAGVLFPTLVALAPGGTAVPMHAGLLLPSTGGLPAPALLLVVLALAVVALRLATRDRRAAPAPAWTCGQRIEPALAWTSAGFTKPLRLTLDALLRPRRELTQRSVHGVMQEVVHRAEVPHHFDTLLYAPAQRAALRGAALARRLQSGSLRTYLGYLLALLLALLALSRLGGLA